ncbi:hypothetical protein ALC60_13988 [Trachymyrmex zeteki]|uniref:THAP-type domain-containing protein n=1 Tax=Mycetomoellerius zeteki TaxID=64791 RepID=A0A151WGN5_9HYME|nr:hypothetical protein ALC60_13988 [Trachymyrmex zeteki]
MKKWLEAISVLWVSNLPEEVKKYRICHLHFDENSYIFTLHRRRLKHDVISTQNLSITTNDSGISQLNSIQVQEENLFEINTQYNEMTATITIDFSLDICQSNTSQEESTVLKSNVNIEKEIQQETQPCDLDIQSTPKKIVVL